MGHVAITFRAEHSETSRVPLDEAVEVFTDTLRMRGYRGDVDVEWSDQEWPEWSQEFHPALVKAAEAFHEKHYAPHEGPLEVLYAFTHKGGGYYDILVDGEIVDTVKGKAAAEAWTPS